MIFDEKELAREVDYSQTVNLAPRAPVMTASCLADMLARVNPQRRPSEMAAKVKVEDSAEESQHEPCLRDREYTKAEAEALEKPHWIEMKDLIFETDKNILDYLKSHTKQWRTAKKHQWFNKKVAEDDTLSVNNSQRNFRRNRVARNTADYGSFPPSQSTSPKRVNSPPRKQGSNNSIAVSNLWQK